MHDAHARCTISASDIVSDIVSGQQTPEATRNTLTRLCVGRPVGRARRDACRWPDPDARSRPALGFSCLRLFRAPSAGLLCLVRLRFAWRSLAMRRVYAIAPGFVSGCRAFSSVSLVTTHGGLHGICPDMLV
jgi:hypothetical protein